MSVVQFAMRSTSFGEATSRRVRNVDGGVAHRRRPSHDFLVGMPRALSARPAPPDARARRAVRAAHANLYICGHDHTRSSSTLIRSCSSAAPDPIPFRFSGCGATRCFRSGNRSWSTSASSWSRSRAASAHRLLRLTRPAAQRLVRLRAPRFVSCRTVDLRHGDVVQTQIDG